MPQRIVTSMGVTGFTSLCLHRGETVEYPSNRPSICTLIRRIQALGYLVTVYYFLTNVFQSLSPYELCYVVQIKDALLVIIWIGDDIGTSSDSSGTSSNSSADFLQVNPEAPELERQNYYMD